MHQSINNRTAGKKKGRPATATHGPTTRKKDGVVFAAEQGKEKGEN